MEKVSIHTDYIKLDQFLKLAGIVLSGAEAKEIILNGEVRLNGNVESARGRKLRVGDIVSFRGNEYGLVGEDE